MASLKKYISKRKIRATKEPLPSLFKRKKGTLQFVVHKHAAHHLHYDLRLEVAGVLKSWAIPKGPSLDPQIKRLAIMVEDHPYAYKDFEGVIPEGYGAGIVLIWDRGNYSVDHLSGKESQEAMQEGLKKGELHFILEGEKLRGEFFLVKLQKKSNDWLLIKKKDEKASSEEITELDRSVASHRSLEEIATEYLHKEKFSL